MKLYTDTQRLDWLALAGEVSWDMLQDCPGDGNICLNAGVLCRAIESKTLRGAIDAAMEQTNEVRSRRTP